MTDHWVVAVAAAAAVGVEAAAAMAAAMAGHTGVHAGTVTCLHLLISRLRGSTGRAYLAGERARSSLI